VKVLLLSTYELGHQPLHLASPLAFLAAAGIDARAIDLAVEPLDEEAVRDADFVAIAVPMHTALRLGAEVGARVKALHPRAHLSYYGLYAPLNREYLLAHGADSIVGGEYEAALVELVRGGAAPDVSLDRLKFAAPARASLPSLDHYARLETAGGARLAGYVEASRGCLHHCRHCPIPPVYGGRFFVVPVDVVVADVSAQVAAGAQHVTLGDPDFLNGPKHALAVARAIHAAHPTLTFDITTKVEHILKHRDVFAETEEALVRGAEAFGVPAGDWRAALAQLAERHPDRTRLVSDVSNQQRHGARRHDEPEGAVLVHERADGRAHNRHLPRAERLR